jgi:hypothetical protein
VLIRPALMGALRPHPQPRGKPSASLETVMAGGWAKTRSPERAAYPLPTKVVNFGTCEPNSRPEGCELRTDGNMLLKRKGDRASAHEGAGDVQTRLDRRANLVSK